MIDMLTRYCPKWQHPGLVKDGRIEGESEAGLGLTTKVLSARTYQVLADKTLTWDRRSDHHGKPLGNFDNVALHRCKDADQLVLFFLRHVEGI